MEQQPAGSKPGPSLLWVTSTLSEPDDVSSGRSGTWKGQFGGQNRRPSLFRFTTSVTTAARVEAGLDPESDITLERIESGNETMKAGRWHHVSMILREIHNAIQGRLFMPAQELKQIIVHETPKPVPGPNQILIKVDHAALCQSHFNATAEQPVATLGHEGTGRIEKIHPSVANKRFGAGDSVGFLSTFGSCGECMDCLIHDIDCTAGQRTIHGLTCDNLFAEYAVVDYSDCIHLPKSFQGNEIAPIFCAGITELHAAGHANLGKGDWFAVIGAGGLAPMAAHIAKGMHLNVVVLDSDDAALDICKAWGADVALNTRSNKKYVDELKRLTNGGAKTACVFSNTDSAYADGPSILRDGGIMMAVGLPQNAIRRSSVDLVLGKPKRDADSSILKRVKKAVVENVAPPCIKSEFPVRRLQELSAVVNETRACSRSGRNMSVSSEKSVTFGEVTYIEDSAR